MLRIAEILLEEPALDWSQRYGARDSLLLSFDVGRSCGQGCQLGHSVMLEYLPGPKSQSFLIGS